MSDNTCIECDGQGGWILHETEPNPSYEPCSHCRETGKCDCEECHPKTYDFTNADQALADLIVQKMVPKADGWCVYVTVPIYNNMDGIVGSRTPVVAIFTSEHCANDYADKLNPQDGDCGDIKAEVKPCKFEVYHQ